MHIQTRTKILTLGTLALSICVLFSNAFLNARPAPVQADVGVKEPLQRPEVTLAFTGDMQFTGTVGEQIKKNGLNYPFAAVKPILTNADVTVGNLETTLTTRGVAQTKDFTFRSDPRMAKAMANAGFDILGLANNHAMDFGQISLQDTIQSLDKEHLAHIGGGKNSAEATSVYYITKKGETIAFLNYSRVLPSAGWMATAKRPGLASAYDPALMYSKVKQAHKKADIVVVFLHWGKELAATPEAYQVNMAHSLIDCGADIIVGNHPHVTQPVEWYKHKLIAYSLGNFVFTNSINNRCNQSAILQVGVTGTTITGKLIPVQIKNGQPRLMTSKEKDSFLNGVSKISPHASVTSAGLILP
ncbi:CapA family protein [Aneurinibacillus terranovensis]|uniref:CapA family protein n=1 Tax=Aneurinibacillus terranovensis TaxID=278991 RepID=UPI00041562C9|nr:CapA family protein [Aneurinibacillus terranovensis]